MRSFTWKKRRPPLTWVSWDYFTHKSLALRAKVWELSNKDKSLVLSYMVFPVVMHGCESWTIKKAVCERIDAFKLWWWRRFLRVPWIARRLNQSVLKEINLEYSLEGLILKLQYFGHLMQRTNSLENTLIKRLRGKREWSDREWDGWVASLNQWTWVWVNSGR